MAEPFMGELKLLPISFAPKGWATCDGQLMPINTNQALFSLLGTMYGGNGQTTFALPDLRGRVPMHSSAIAQGSAFGAESVTLTQSEMPAHTHLVSADTTFAPASDGNLPSSTRRLAASSPGSLYGPPRNLAPMAPAVVGQVGGSQAHANMQPYLALTWCIALQGIFPSRN
jgi:microcystin-dependent protein